MQTDMREQTSWRGDQVLKAAVVEQASPELQRIRTLVVEYQQGGEWKACYRGGNPGERLDVTFAPVTAQRVRLNITEATDGPTLCEFQLFPPEK